jgi:hypothetical protein
MQQGMGLEWWEGNMLELFLDTGRLVVAVAGPCRTEVAGVQR